MGSWRAPSSANQNSSSIRALIREAKKKGYKVVTGNFHNDDPDLGPIYTLTGDQTVRAWFNASGEPRFMLL